MEEVKPDRVVIEICSMAGWVCDLVRRKGVEIEVANTADDAWRWRKVKKKNDRHDALKAAQLSAVNQLREVYIPATEVRQWRALIAYRQQMVWRRTKIKNHIRDLLLREGQILPRGQKCWTQLGVATLKAMTRSFAEVELHELWRAELGLELAQLREVQQKVQELEEKLNAIGAADVRVQLLRTIPGVGPRLAEAIVALLDDPKRFRRSRSVGAYLCLTPRRYQSDEVDRIGRITKIGDGETRAALFEAANVILRPTTRWSSMKAWAMKIASRQGARRAKVALARRMAVTPHRMWVADMP